MTQTFLSQVSGFLLVDKSAGRTSFNVVHTVRACLGKLKVGHAGTLDPLATGILILGLGRATKNLASVMALDKEYAFTVEFGHATDTDDTEGVDLYRKDCGAVTAGDIERLLPAFTGKLKQRPPVYSAVKIKGRHSYALARKGIIPELKEKEVTIYSLSLLSYTPPRAAFKMICSTGTYVRSFARDMGERLGCGGCVCELRRTRIGPFKAESALPFCEITPASISAHLLQPGEMQAAIAAYAPPARMVCSC